jgi:hypothetical protein
MAVPCIQKKNSTVPICDVHNVPLKQQDILIDPNAPSLGRISCYICPASHSVVREMRRAYGHGAR